MRFNFNTQLVRTPAERRVVDMIKQSNPIKQWRGLILRFDGVTGAEFKQSYMTVGFDATITDDASVARHVHATLRDVKATHEFAAEFFPYATKLNPPELTREKDESRIKPGFLIVSFSTHLMKAADERGARSMEAVQRLAGPLVGALCDFDGVYYADVYLREIQLQFDVPDDAGELAVFLEDLKLHVQVVIESANQENSGFNPRNTSEKFFPYVDYGEDIAIEFDHA